MKDFVYKNSKIVTLSRDNWSMPYSMVGLVVTPEEHGKWAANTAKAVLEGFPIKDISITTNKRWNYYLNLELLKASNIKVPRPLLIKSKKYERK